MSMHRRLVETAEVQLLVRQLGTDIDFQNELAFWGQVSVPELSVVLVHLELTARTHKNHHWQAKADPFYGDHLLFDRLAGDVAGFVDKVAEKAIGMGGPENVDLALRTEALVRLTALGPTQGSTVPGRDELARRSLAATASMVRVLDLAAGSMREVGTLTRGVDNMLAGIEDAVEDGFYLLKQRIMGEQR
jgi:hypothetical protein